MAAPLIRPPGFVLYYDVGLAPRGSISHVAEELIDLGNSQPKRKAPAQSHQATKAASKKKRKIDWTRIALIIIGIMIVISMILSLIRF